MNIINIPALLLASAFLASCAASDTYVEPTNSGQKLAVIKTQYTDILSYSLGRLVMKPDNSIRLAKIDGKQTGFFASDTNNIQPGRHQLTFVCTLDGRIFGSKEMTINALPGKTYYVSFPKYLHGYAIDFDACNKLTIR